MAKRKLHQWEKIITKYEDALDHNGVNHRLIKCHECIKCGLKKGFTKDFDQFGSWVYYEDINILSLDILPFECVSNGRVEPRLKSLKKQKKEQENSFLFSEDDFNV